jgi:hypothetical protein
MDCSVGVDVGVVWVVLLVALSDGVTEIFLIIIEEVVPAVG